MQNHIRINVKTSVFLIALYCLNSCTNVEAYKTPPHLSHKSGEVSHDIPKPAILLESNTQNTQIFQQAMSAALNGKKVTLNKNAFTKRPHHILQKRSFTQPGMNLDGLILEAPEVNRFSLYTSNNSCYLIHDNSEKRIFLENIECKPFQ